MTSIVTSGTTPRKSSTQIGERFRPWGHSDDAVDKASTSQYRLKPSIEGYSLDIGYKVCQPQSCLVKIFIDSEDLIEACNVSGAKARQCQDRGVIRFGNGEAVKGVDWSLRPGDENASGDCHNDGHNDSRTDDPNNGHINDSRDDTSGQYRAGT